MSKITIDTETGDWVAEAQQITSAEGFVVAASVLPGITPEQVKEFYDATMVIPERPESGVVTLDDMAVDMAMSSLFVESGFAVTGVRPVAITVAGSRPFTKLANPTYGRIICLFRGHHFPTIAEACRRAGVLPQGPIPMIHCDRCGVEA